MLAYGALCLAAIKLVDVLLSLKKGLAMGVGAFSFVNAGLILFADRTLTSPFTGDCASQPVGAGASIEFLVNVACLNWQMTVRIIAASLFGATMLFYSQELVRGIRDVGFVGASLRAERRRRQGI
ncbi:MAG TPA: hypothetical protein VGI22_21440 [Xanthobacteraceae bacterium]